MPPVHLVFFNRRHAEPPREREPGDRAHARAGPPSCFAQRTPLLYVAGNHETRAGSPPPRRLRRAPRRPLHGAFSHGPVRFVVLDTGRTRWTGIGVQWPHRFRIVTARRADSVARRRVEEPAVRRGPFPGAGASHPLLPAWPSAPRGTAFSTARALRSAPEQAGIDLGLAATIIAWRFIRQTGRRVPFPLIVAAARRAARARAFG